jgi:hypothetical protein
MPQVCMHDCVLVQKEERFFACKWTHDEETGNPWLLLAGRP